VNDPRIPSEARLWGALRGRRLGCASLRQALIGPFIVDFVARAAKRVVEVDGEYHSRRQRLDVGRDDLRIERRVLLPRFDLRRRTC